MFGPSDLPVPLGAIWGFVALQYHTLILNRVYVVCVGTDSLIGLVGRGIVAQPVLVAEAMFNPTWWPRRAKLLKYPPLQFADQAVVSAASANFRVSFGDVESITYTADKKWGMGTVPYSGRIFIGVGGKAREFILLGREDGRAVCNRLRQACGVA